ncbi:low molecular weight protein-tyrosine-phosphatase [Primorskyibacter sp. S87]|uniref:low molecular weight protein-tyrosine-phosphatase n=1 Tax=Primorskyibacter sp. S87 TaxID=3415126 RepID=UPI003C799079
MTQPANCRILFVCLGNICRSPTAEGVFRSAVPEADADSAGTAGWHVGNPPYGPMQAAAQARGYDLSELRARTVQARDFSEFDLILAMDENNLADLERLRPSPDGAPVRLLTEFGSGLSDHVPDPYYTRDFDAALDIIEDAVSGLKQALERGLV